jgi:hypothetical protein
MKAMKTYRATADFIFESYLQSLIPIINELTTMSDEAVVRALGKVELDRMSGVWEIEWLGFLILATPYWEGEAGLGVSIMDDGEPVNLNFTDKAMEYEITGDRERDAKKYLSILKLFLVRDLARQKRSL